MLGHVDVNQTSHDDASGEHFALKADSNNVDSKVHTDEESSDHPPSTLTSKEILNDSDLVYSRHSFEAKVDGQASVYEGDRLSLMDDSNSHWWLVKVIKTQEVGYIPAKIIETPVERLARLSKTSNGSDLVMQEDLNAMHDEYHVESFYSPSGSRAQSPSPSALHDSTDAPAPPEPVPVEIMVERHTVTAVL